MKSTIRFTLLLCFAGLFLLGGPASALQGGGVTVDHGDTPSGVGGFDGIGTHGGGRITVDHGVVPGLGGGYDGIGTHPGNRITVEHGVVPGPVVGYERIFP